ncbi:MAG TPA: hypothetical protein VL967_05895 [Terracidiphilus sp.]|nr:hypothetical protein [Terracidiphilus sp.]
MRQRTLKHLIVTVAVVLCSATGLNAQSAGQAPLALPLQFAGTAFGQAGAAAGKSFGFTVFIDQWTTDDQAKEFMDTLKENGPDALVKAFGKTKDVGRVSPTGFTGNSFRFARWRPTPGGGMHIVMVTDRPMRFWEVYNSGRSTTYPFGIIVLNVDSTGKGTGTLAPICKIKFNKKGELEIENYGQKPLRLVNVRVEKQGGKE